MTDKKKAAPSPKLLTKEELFQLAVEKGMQSPEYMAALDASLRASFKAKAEAKATRH